MFEYELEEYIDYNNLYNNLILKDTTNIEITVTDSIKREDLIIQLMMDKFNLDLNKDSRFEKDRKIYFYNISYYKERDPNTKIKKTKILKTGKNKNIEFEVNGIVYKINLNKKNSSAKRDLTDEEFKVYKSKDEISFHTFKTNSSDVNNISQIQNEKEDDINIKKLKDIIKNEIYILEIIHNKHEVNGNLITKEDINIQNGLKEILYYPKIEVENVETEVESSKNDGELKEEESNEIRVNFKISEKEDGSKIIEKSDKEESIKKKRRNNGKKWEKRKFRKNSKRIK